MLTQELVRFLEIETYVHATESLDKIVQAIERNVLLSEKVPIVFEVLWGIFGNPIIRIHIFIDDTAVAEKILLNIMCKMKNLDKLLKTISQRLDKAGTLYIRINKHQLVLDDIVLDDESDDIVRIKARIARRVLKEGNLGKIIEERCLSQHETCQTSG